MTNPAYRHIIMMVDRSGSMHACRAATEEGVNGLFAGQAAQEEGWATASLYQFDTEHEVVFEHVAAADVPPYRLAPRGGTALLDAIGFAFLREGAWLAALPEQERPGTVVAVIATDGFENSSREFKREQIEAMVREQQEVYSWNILFLGANMDAIQVAAAYGIPAAHAMTFVPSSRGVTGTYGSVAQAMARGSRGEGYGFTPQERAEAVRED